MELGELLERLKIDDQSLPVTYSDGSRRGDTYKVGLRLHGHGPLKSYHVESIEVSPYGVHIVARAKERSA